VLGGVYIKGATCIPVGISIYLNSYNTGYRDASTNVYNTDYMHGF